MAEIRLRNVSKELEKQFAAIEQHFHTVTTSDAIERLIKQFFIDQETIERLEHANASLSKANKEYENREANSTDVMYKFIFMARRFSQSLTAELKQGEENAKKMIAQFDKGKSVSLERVARSSEGFTGSEIATLVTDAMYSAFADGARDLTTDDLLAAARTVVPLNKSASEKIERLRAWAKGRARPATSDVAEFGEQKACVRALDL